MFVVTNCYDKKIAGDLAGSCSLFRLLERNNRSHGTAGYRRALGYMTDQKLNPLPISNYAFKQACVKLRTTVGPLQTGPNDSHRGFGWDKGDYLGSLMVLFREGCHKSNSVHYW